MSVEIRVLPDAGALQQAAAAEFVMAAMEAIEARGAFHVVMSGGSTPKAMFALLAQGPQLPWNQVHFYWGDERHVPPDHPDSNYRMANEALLSKVAVRPAQVFRMPAENSDANAAAQEYEHALNKVFGGELPRFDLVLLGMGPDGHTASLFPGTKALHETKRWIVSNWVGKFYTERITMTTPVLNNASMVMFLVGGPDKAAPLKAVLEGPYEPDQLPSQLIRPASGRFLWLIDQAAGSMLGPK